MNSSFNKPKSSNGKINKAKNSREQFKKGINKIKFKNQSQKNILGESNKNNMTMNDDIVMVDENAVYEKKDKKMKYHVRIIIISMIIK